MSRPWSAFGIGNVRRSPDFASFFRRKSGYDRNSHSLFYRLLDRLLIFNTCNDLKLIQIDSALRSCFPASFLVPDPSSRMIRHSPLIQLISSIFWCNTWYFSVFGDHYQFILIKRNIFTVFFLQNRSCTSTSTIWPNDLGHNLTAVRFKKLYLFFRIPFIELHQKFRKQMFVPEL